MNYIFDHQGFEPAPVHLPGFDLPRFDPDNPTPWRESAEAALERMLDIQMSLITALDLMDGDADLEPTLDGETATWIENGLARASAWKGFGQVEAIDGEEDGGDDEPSLAAFEHHPSIYGGAGSQIGWAAGDASDKEVGDGDDEPDVDDEFSLGMREETDQTFPKHDVGMWGMGEGEQDVQDEPHDEDSDREPDEDGEPSLSRPEHMNQASVHFGNDFEHEVDRSDEGPDVAVPSVRP